MNLSRPHTTVPQKALPEMDVEMLDMGNGNTPNSSTSFIDPNDELELAEAMMATSITLDSEANDNIDEYINSDSIPNLFKRAWIDKDFARLTFLIEEHGATLPVQQNVYYGLDSVWDVLDTNNNWIPATIMGWNGDNVKIHYVGYSDKWDETIDRRKSFYRIAPYQTYSNHNVELSKDFFEWQKHIQSVFYNAVTMSEMEFVHKYLVQFIDTNNIAYLQTLLSRAIEVGYPDKTILLLLSLNVIPSNADIEMAYTNKMDNVLIPLINSNEKIDAYYYCRRAAEVQLWPLVEKFYNQEFFTEYPQAQVGLVEIAFSQANFDQIKAITQFDGSSDGIKLNIEHVKNTFMKAANQEDWEYVCLFLAKFKADPSVNLIMNALFKHALTCDVNNETLVLLRSVGRLIVNEELFDIAVNHNKLAWIKQNEKDILGGLAEKKAKQDDWSMADQFLENTPIPDSSLVKLYLIALQQSKLDKLQKLSNSGLNISDSYYLTHIAMSLHGPSLVEGSECNYQADDEKWYWAIVKYVKGDLLFMHYGEARLSAWIDRKVYPMRFLSLSTKSIANPKGTYALNLKKRLEDTLLMATTTAEWEYVCQTLDQLIKGKIAGKRYVAFDNIYLSKLFTRALITQAESKVLSTLLSLGTVIQTGHIATSIAQYISLEWLREVNKDNLLEIIYRSAYNNNWSIVSDCIEYLEFEKVLFQDLLSIALTENQFNLMKQLILLGASIPELDPSVFYSLKFDVIKMGVEQGVTIDGKDNKGVWHESTILRRDGNVVVYKYFLDASGTYNCINIKETPDRIEPYLSKTNPDSVKKPERVKIRESIKLTLLKAVTASDFAFACDQIDKVFPIERVALLQSLLERALENHALDPASENYSDEDAVNYMIAQHDAFTASHLSLSFKLPKTDQLNTILHEDKKISNEDVLIKAGTEFKWDHVHVYLDFRMPHPETLASLILSAYIDKNESYVEFKRLIARNVRFKQQMPEALKSCFTYAFNYNQVDLAQMLVIIGKLPVWDEIFLTANTPTQLQFVSDYLDRIGYMNVAREHVQKFIYHALSQKAYALTLNLFNSYTQYFLKDSPAKQILLADLFKYCHSKIDADGNIIQVKNSIWNREAFTQEFKFVTACKLIDYVLTGVNNFSKLELDALNSSDLKSSITTSVTAWLPDPMLSTAIHRN